MSTIRNDKPSHTSSPTSANKAGAPKTPDHVAKTAAQARSEETKSAPKSHPASCPAPQKSDGSQISQEARQGTDRRSPQVVDGLLNTWGDERRSGVERRQTAQESQDPKIQEHQKEEQRRSKADDTLRVLSQYSDFTNGKDDVTSKEDYTKIASGQKNGDFAKYLKDKNPDWSQKQIDEEVSKLQSSSKSLLSDRRTFKLADTADNGGKGDDKISDKDLIAARLKNDISKDFSPRLSVEETVKLHEKDPALGNQAVTNRYAHEAKEMNKILGGDDKNFYATWPAYGQHASNSAGAFIRDDGVPGSDAIQNAVAGGNRKVFEDIAPHFDSYIDTFGKNPKANFKEWEAKQDFSDKPYLKQSFEYLEKARTEKDPDKKQEYLLASNALGAYHEQQRLDPNIDKATAPGTGTSVERGVWDFVAGEKPKLFLPNGKGQGDLDSIDVSKKLDVPDKAIPDSLKNISDPGVRDVLKMVLENPGADVSSGRALVDKSGTADWSSLPDRMRTIVGLMVGGQNDPRLSEYALDYNPPASPSTVDHLKSAAGHGAKEVAIDAALGPAGALARHLWPG